MSTDTATQTRRAWRLMSAGALMLASLSILITALVYVDSAEDDRVIRSNQCDALNRLAETKLVLRDLVQTVDDRTVPEFLAAEARLTAGIDDLVRRVESLDGCETFSYVKSRK